MRRRVLKFVALFLCLFAVVVLMPAPRPRPRAELPAPPKPPISWSALEQAVDAQKWWYATVSAQAASNPVRVSLPRRSGTRHGYNSTEECIVARENGGSYDRGTNPTHFGRYQFSRQTWAANGGDPNTWGSASPEEQDQVFANTVASSGYSAWTPYDGC